MTYLKYTGPTSASGNRNAIGSSPKCGDSFTSRDSEITEVFGHKFAPPFCNKRPRGLDALLGHLLVKVKPEM